MADDINVLDALDEPDALPWWLGDAAKILRCNGTTTHADKVAQAAERIRALEAQLLEAHAILTDGCTWPLNSDYLDRVEVLCAKIEALGISPIETRIEGENNGT
jgi:hypothetical protein